MAEALRRAQIERGDAPVNGVPDERTAGLTEFDAHASDSESAGSAPVDAAHSHVVEAAAPAAEEVTFAPAAVAPSRRRWRGLAVAAGILVTVALVGRQQQWFGASALPTGEFAVRPTALREIVGAKGRVEPLSEVRLTAKMLGRIERVLVKEGDRVNAGDIVVEMESADLRVQLEHARSRLEEARAKLADVQRGPRPQELNTARTRVAESTAVLREARAALERGRLLESRSLISRSDLEEIVTRHERAAAQLDVANQELSLVEDGAPAEVRQMLAAQYRSAEAAVREVEVQLEYASIRAPMAGVVTRRFMEAGEVIIMQRPQPILTIADVSKLLVRAEVDESAVPRLAVGQEATVRSSTHPGQRFNGRIVELAPSIGRKTITGEDPAEMVDSKVLEAAIEMAPESQLMLGQTVDVEITTARRNAVLAVPREAIEVRSGDSYVQVKSASGWTKRRIVTGESQAGMIEIVEGLRQGETVALHRPAE